MSYFSGINWDAIKKDVQRGVEKGIVAVKKGAVVAKKAASEATDEGKRQYRIMVLKAKVHSGISDLGARVYSLIATGSKNPAQDVRVKELVKQIKTFEAQLAALEGAPRPAARKKTK